MKVLIVGGGSAGHVLPTVPIVTALAEEGHDVVFVGTHSGLEADLVAELPCDFRAISAGKLRRYLSLENVLDIFRTLLGIFQSLLLVLKTKPQVIFSKGGYVSFPLVLAGWICRVPIVAHESDISPGLANRLVTPFANTICTSFADTAFKGAKTHVVHTGTPLRAEIVDGSATTGRQRLGISPDKPLLVVTGGSLGADRLNEIVRSEIQELTQTFYVFHVCGPGKLVAMEVSDYVQAEFVAEGWGDVLAAADVVLSRAGANALFELVALQKKNLLVPLPKVASRGDQIENAAYAQARGWSLVIAEEDLTPQSLGAAVRQLLEQGEQWTTRLAEFATPNAAHAIVMEIHAAARKSP
ncbi:MAG: UDP-N-acetylglucosamine--N-acetylmuramyl-(pentapeptide) pyrophosphoryl-undecaprenol N-acetylglucosamine transferase [Pseudomonadales bacterium]|nr:UDP-N-acetylglucosamine--N-acetylmuramyl-(pentapeptide) pyrophosphoryl-undecaprenol N-acetylglucosamine transferase [Pseudomonadales bacterium]